MASATLEAVTDTDLHVRVGDRVYTVPFTAYPALRNASPAALARITASPTTLRWPDLDVDIALEALEYPDRYPLLFDHEKRRGIL